MTTSSTTPAASTSTVMSLLSALEGNLGDIKTAIVARGQNVSSDVTVAEDLANAIVDAFAAGGNPVAITAEAAAPLAEGIINAAVKAFAPAAAPSPAPAS